MTVATLSEIRRGNNVVCGEDITSVGLESHDAVVELIGNMSNYRDMTLPQRGDPPKHQRVHGQSHEYRNPAYKNMGDGVSGGLLELMPSRGCQFAQSS